MTFEPTWKLVRTPPAGESLACGRCFRHLPFDGVAYERRSRLGLLIARRCLNCFMTDESDRDVKKKLAPIGPSGL
jgi:hypothetical protein